MRNCECSGGDAALYLTLTDNALIEHNLFHNQNSLNPATFHTNVIYTGTLTNTTIRYNAFYNIYVEGILFGDPNNSNVLIYDNLFYQGPIGPQSGARALEWQGSGQSGIHVYNNVFVGLGIGVRLDIGTYSGCFLQNNISRNCSFPTSNAGWTIDHNYIDGTDPFINSSAFDYHLRSESPAIGVSLNLGSAYGIDYDSNGR